MTVRTATELLTLLPQLIEDNTNKRISPMDVRTIVGDVIDSYTAGDATLAQATNALDTALRQLIAQKQDALPAYNQVATQALLSRAGNLFWQTLNLVPNTPGTAGGIGRALIVTGEGDRDYAWRVLPGGSAGADTTARAAAQAAQDTADANARNIQTLGEQNNNLQRQASELIRKAADLDIVSDGLGWAQATSDEAGFTLFAQGSTVGDGLLNGDRPLEAADLSSVSWMQTTPIGATVQAVIVRVEGTLGPVDFALRVGDIINQLHDFRKVLSDSQWDYYYLGGVSNQTIRVDRRAEEEHTRFHGELTGRALGPSQAVRAVADRAETKADDAQRDVDIVFEAEPPFIENVVTARNLNVSLRHPPGLFPDADILWVTVEGQTPVLVAYSPGDLQQTVRVGISATTMDNIFGSSARSRKVAGDFVTVQFRLQEGTAIFPPGHAQAGQTNPDAIFYARNVDVPVVAQAAAIVDQAARDAAAAAQLTADGKANPGDIPERIPDAPANDASAAKRYELSVPQTRGVPVWAEVAAAAGGGLEPIQIAHLLGLELEPESVAGTVAGMTRTFVLHVDYPSAFGEGQVDVWFEVFVDTIRVVNRTRWSATAEDINVPIAALQAQNLLRAHAAAGFVEVHIDFYSQESGGVRFSRRDLVLSLVAESVPSPPDNDASAAKDYVLSVPRARGAATWKEDVGPPVLVEVESHSATWRAADTTSDVRVGSFTLENLKSGDVVKFLVRARNTSSRFVSGTARASYVLSLSSSSNSDLETSGGSILSPAASSSRFQVSAASDWEGVDGTYYHLESSTSQTFYLFRRISASGAAGRQGTSEGTVHALRLN